MDGLILNYIIGVYNKSEDIEKTCIQLDLCILSNNIKVQDSTLLTYCMHEDNILLSTATGNINKNGNTAPLHTPTLVPVNPSISKEVDGNE